MLNKVLLLICVMSAAISPFYPAIPPRHQRLMCNGTLLNDNRALSDYGIENGSVLRLDKMIYITVDPGSNFHAGVVAAGSEEHPSSTAFPLKVGYA